MSLEKPILYTYFRSTCSWRVRIALNLKNIEYDSEYIHLVKNGGQQHTEDYKMKNPMAQLPTLQIKNNIFLTQSIPIIEYLDETYVNSKPLLPRDPILKAKVRALSEMIASGIQPIQNLSVLKYLGDDQEKRKSWAKHWINEGFIAIEKALKDSAGEYCFGDTVTMADCCLVPQVYNANRYGVDMSQFPIINRICENMNKMDAVMKAHFSNQIDCPEELK